MGIIRRFLPTAATALLVLSSLTACSLSSDGSGKPTHQEEPSMFWYGTLPFEQRVSIEDFQRKTEPVLLEFRQQLSQAGAGDYTALTKSSQLNGCLEQQDKGYEVKGQIVRGAPVPAETVQKLASKLLAPSGLTTPVEDTGPGRLSLFWYDTENGGYVDVTIREGQFTTFGYRSGCRPSDGETTHPGEFLPNRPPDLPYED